MRFEALRNRLFHKSTAGPENSAKILPCNRGKGVDESGLAVAVHILLQRVPLAFGIPDFLHLTIIPFVH